MKSKKSIPKKFVKESMIAIVPGENLENRKIGMTKVESKPPKQEIASRREVSFFDLGRKSKSNGISNPVRNPIKKTIG